MSESLLIGILSSFSALLGVAISRFFDERKRKSEERRWYAGFLMDRKFEALQNLFGALVDCRFMLKSYGNFPPQSVKEHREQVNSKEEAFTRARVMASLYLDDEADDVMGKVLLSFQQAVIAIYLNIPRDELPVNPDTYDPPLHQIDWKGLDDSYEAAVKCLRSLLHPSVIQEIAESG